MIGYKIAVACDKAIGPFFVVVTIDTLDSVIRTCGNKSRCEYAIVKNIAPYCLFGNIVSDEKYKKMTAYSVYELASYYNMYAAACDWVKIYTDMTDIIKTRYKVGDRVSCDYFVNVDIECAPGIHFFASYEQLVDWVDDGGNVSFPQRVLCVLNDNMWNSFNQYSPKCVKALFDEISGDYEL
jgi:hypothetical protein